ncbi:MAG: PAS domain-containing protein, partial [Pseudomonadota bacterium]
MASDAAMQSKKKAVDFTIDEVFFSRTDDRGVILTCNDVFKRVAEFDWSELIGAPHKVVRHPEMPKSVFHLMWARLKNDEPVIAYVKNKTKCGKPYWVIAFAAPMGDGGYISFRVKPVSEIFEQIKPLYDALLKEEAEIEWSAENHGHSELLERLAQIGYPSYEAFASQAAVAEVTERARLRKQICDPILSNLSGVPEKVQLLSRKVAALNDVFQRIRTTPVNLGIMANRIERSGGPISAISGIYSSMSTEIGDWLDGFLRNSELAFERMEKQSSDCLTMIATAGVQEEMLEAYGKEDLAECGYNNFDEEVRLKNRSRASTRAARRATSAICNDAIELQNAVHVLKRHVMSLSSTRVLCEIESAKLPTRSESLEGVVAQLASFQDEIEDLHKEIESATQSI